MTASLDRVLRAWDRLEWAVRKRGILGAARRALSGRARPRSEEEAYALWRAIHEPRRTASRRRERWQGGSVPVLLQCVDGLGAEQLERTLGSLRAQEQVPWTAWVALPSPPGRLGDATAALADVDPRVTVVEPGVALDAALAAAGDVAVLASPGIVLAPDALESLVSAMRDDALVELVYGDEDRIDASGRRFAPSFKPEFSMDLLRSTPYTGRLLGFRTGLAARAGGIDGGEPHDVALRLTERARRIAHLARVLHHVPDDLGIDEGASARAITHALSRTGEEGAVDALGGGRFRVRYRVRGEPLVSVVIPTRDRVELLRVAVASVLERSGWRNLELLVVDNGSTDPETLRFLEDIGPPHRVIRRPGPFDWAALNNDAAREARGEYLLFLNNDIEATEPGWIEALLEHAQRPGVGAVGAKLLYPDGTVQHAGIALGMEGFAGHPFRGALASEPGPCGVLSVARECSAVTGACLMISRELFDSLGGFDPELRIAFNDVDLCLRARERGHRTVWTPHARLVHHESASRSAEHPRGEYLRVRRRWGALALAGDPHLPPNLDREIAARAVRARRWSAPG
ncbi:glycosyltransferase [Anaeromyxobacter terrae]|uniref:glycosyltransferase n=1 Tax=Anaeromyxobacter terrae TaxID=2925406 RepID=UPI001F567A62|nr:glycosyltransferase family 2 protein [Anaeromyxobacter sp. SG22]